jgi:hypothetical protein
MGWSKDQADALIEAQGVQDTDFDFRHIEPAGVLGV